MKRGDINILEKYGWVVICESPFEIEYEGESRDTATGQAAEIVLSYFKRKERIKNMRGV